MEPIKLPSEMRLPNSQPIITEYLRNEILIFSSKETESEVINNYLQIIAGHGHALAAHGT